MGELVIWEAQYIAVVVTLGIGLAVVYDCFRILRRLIPHNVFWLSVEDILFWMFAALAVFVVCFVEDAGNVRWFAIGGAAFGAYMYNCTIGPVIVKYVSLLLYFPVKLLKKALKKLVKSFTIKKVN